MYIQIYIVYKYIKINIQYINILESICMSKYTLKNLYKYTKINTIYTYMHICMHINTKKYIYVYKYTKINIYKYIKINIT